MNNQEVKQLNMYHLKNYIYCESTLMYELYDEDIIHLNEVRDKKAFDPFMSMNNTIREYEILEYCTDKDEFNIQLSRITKLTEDRYDFFTDMDDAPFDLQDDNDEIVKLIIKAQLKIIYYCEELVQE